MTTPRCRTRRPSGTSTSADTPGRSCCSLVASRSRRRSTSSCGASHARFRATRTPSSRSSGPTTRASRRRCVDSPGSSASPTTCVSFRRYMARRSSRRSRPPASGSSRRIPRTSASARSRRLPADCRSSSRRTSISQRRCSTRARPSWRQSSRTRSGRRSSRCLTMAPAAHDTARRLGHSPPPMTGAESRRHWLRSIGRSSRPRAPAGRRGPCDPNGCARRASWSACCGRRATGRPCGTAWRPRSSTRPSRSDTTFAASSMSVPTRASSRPLRPLDFHAPRCGRSSRCRGRERDWSGS